MVEKIKSLKDRLLEQAEKDLQDKGAGRMDGELIDMIKDLAEAEKSCWEAEYYRTVTEQMGGQSGYQQMGNMDHYGRSGWQNQYGGGYRRGYGMSGYGDAVEGVRNILNAATPEERERIKNEMRSI